MIKFQKYYITNGQYKARVRYSHGMLTNGKMAITIYAKDWQNDLNKIFKDEYKNDTDSQSDYFEQGLARIYPENPMFEKALERCAS